MTAVQLSEISAVRHTQLERTIRRHLAVGGLTAQPHFLVIVADQGIVTPNVVFLTRESLTRQQNPPEEQVDCSNNSVSNNNNNYADDCFNT